MGADRHEAREGSMHESVQAVHSCKLVHLCSCTGKKLAPLVLPVAGNLLALSWRLKSLQVTRGNKRTA